jgi:hypothetical protein
MQKSHMHSSQLDGRYSIEGLGRVYTDHNDVWLPSVSTVINVRETPEQLKQWKERTDNYEEIMHYKRNRGTIVHAKILQELVPNDPISQKPIKELWGKDEDASHSSLQDAGEWERMQNDMDKIADMWDIITEYANIDYVHDVETLVCNPGIGYAGQFDLCYEDQVNNETVLADLKTSKGVYDKHMLQLTAYKNALPMSIDRMEVLRINPDYNDWRLLPDSEWDTDPDDLWTEFIKLRSELEKSQIKTIIQSARESEEADAGIMYESM